MAMEEGCIYIKVEVLRSVMLTLAKIMAISLLQLE
jgi:hypothetical protein